MLLHFFVYILVVIFGKVSSDNLKTGGGLDTNYVENHSSETCDSEGYRCNKYSGGEYDQYSKNVGWIAKPLTDALWAFSPDPFSNKTSTLCSKHAQIYKKHLENNYLWATQMMDASTLAPLGILSGNNFQLGHFDQCLDVHADIGEDIGTINGHYCLAKIILNPAYDAFPHYYDEKFVENPYDMRYNPLLSSWTKMKLTEDPSKIQRNRIYWSVCVPASCSPREIEIGLEEKIIPELAKKGITASVTIDEKLCQVKSEKKFTTSSIIFMLFALLSIILVVISTVFDVAFYRNSEWTTNKKNKKGKLESVMLSFSVYQNCLNLNKPDRTDDLNIIHGMRTYTTILVLLGHRCMFSYGSPFYNPEFLEHRYRTFSEIFILNGMLIVDTFFVISGFLTCYMILDNLRNNESLNILHIYLHRLLRIIPLYAIVLAIYINVLPLIGDGPMWSLKAGVEIERCRNIWWTNILFINNYIDGDFCMFQSWFLACDMHFFVFGPILAYLLHKRPKFGLFLTISLLPINIIFLFRLIYTTNLDGVLRIYMSTVEDPMTNDYVRNVYIKSHNRVGPYIVGILAGYLYFVIKNTNFKFSSFQVYCGTIINTVLAIGSLTLASIFYIPGRDYNVIENALYSALHRIIWSCAMSWLIIIGGTSTFGVASQILCMKFLIPLSRLTYAVFLTHGMIQLYSVSTVRVSEYIRFPKLFWMWSADVTQSFTIALVLHLVFEAPLNGLSRILVSSLLQREKSENKVEEEKLDEKQKSDATKNHSELQHKMNGSRNNKRISKSKPIVATVVESTVPKIENKHL